MINYDLGKKDIRERTFKFALRIIKLCRALPRDEINRVLVRQLIRAGTSVGANIEEATGALTKNDFAHSLNIAKKEAYETNYWLRLIYASMTAEIRNRMTELIKESEEILKILTSSVKTAQKKKN
ncbi:MAG: four helix bundle protein [Microgenomates group bacterium]